MEKKIHYGNIIDKSYFGYIFFMFCIFSIFIIFFVVSSTDSAEIVLLKFFSIMFLFMLVSVFIEISSSSEYMNPIDLVNLRCFFDNFIKNKGKRLFHKYDSKTKKRVKRLFDIGEKFNISSVIKRDRVYIISFHRDISNKNMFLGLVLGLRSHKLYVKEIKGEFKIVRLK